jgi:hypothetical protein
MAMETNGHGENSMAMKASSHGVPWVSAITIETHSQGDSMAMAIELQVPRTWVSSSSMFMELKPTAVDGTPRPCSLILFYLLSFVLFFIFLLGKCFYFFLSIFSLFLLSFISRKIPPM